MPRRGWSLVIATVLAMFLLQVQFADRDTRFDELALGNQTTSIFAKVDGISVHAQTRVDADSVVAAAVERSASSRVLWLGNSQLHAVNQYRVGDESAPKTLHRILRARNVDLVTLSFPNANVQEHFIAFSYAMAALPDLKLLVLPVVFDDFREIGVRDDWRGALSHPAVKDALSSSSIGEELLSEAPTAPSDETLDADLEGVRDTFQERSEGALVRWLDAHSTLWRARVEGRGKIFTNLYHLRNTVFGITPQSKRPLKPAAYNRNRDALREILRFAARSNVRVLVYVVPLRNDVEPPYVTAEYEQFKADMRALSGVHGAAFADLEDIVPAALWGSKDPTGLGSERAELDFMHFQGEGHRLLAHALAREIEQVLGTTAL